MPKGVRRGIWVKKRCDNWCVFQRNYDVSMNVCFSLLSTCVWLALISDGIPYNSK